MLINSLTNISSSRKVQATESLSKPKAGYLDREKSTLISCQASPSDSSCFGGMKKAMLRFFLFCRDLFSAFKGQFTSYDEKRLVQIALTKKFIYFYDQRNSLTYFLGNYYPCQVSMNYRNPQTNNTEKLVFPNSEAMYQALKFTHLPSLVHRFTKVKNGHEAWQLGQDNKNKIRKDWDSVDCMKHVLQAKFSQNPELKKRLLSTQKAYLVEHTPRDAFWGDKGDGSGQNMLGRLLMQTRGMLGGTAEVPPPSEYVSFLKQQKN